MRVLSFVLRILLIALLIGGCGPTPTPAPTEPPTPTSPPLPTATPEIPLAILVLPADMDAEQSQRYQSTVYELAQAAGYRFQVRNVFTTADLEPALKIVIVLPPDPGIAALAAAAPQTQFLAVNLPDVAPTSNLSVIGQPNRPEIVGFFLGYLSAMITSEYDYRIGMIALQGDPQAQIAFAAFRNGMVYYCGTCPKAYYYFDIYGNALDYPQLVEIPADEDLKLYPAYGRILKQKKVAMAYAHSSVATPDLLTTLGVEGIISTGETPPEPLPLYWAASLKPDFPAAIRLAWPDLLAGRGGQSISPPLKLTDVDPTLLPPGKQALAEQVLADLLAGRIAPLTP